MSITQAKVIANVPAVTPAPTEHSEDSKDYTSMSRAEIQPNLKKGTKKANLFKCSVCFLEQPALDHTTLLDQSDDDGDIVRNRLCRNCVKSQSAFFSVFGSQLSSINTTKPTAVVVDDDDHGSTTTPSITERNISPVSSSIKNMKKTGGADTITTNASGRPTHSINRSPDLMTSQQKTGKKKAQPTEHNTSHFEPRRGNKHPRETNEIIMGNEDEENNKSVTNTMKLSSVDVSQSNDHKRQKLMSLQQDEERMRLPLSSRALKASSHPDPDQTGRHPGHHVNLQMNKFTGVDNSSSYRPQYQNHTARGAVAAAHDSLEGIQELQYLQRLNYIREAAADPSVSIHDLTSPRSIHGTGASVSHLKDDIYQGLINSAAAATNPIHQRMGYPYDLSSLPSNRYQGLLDTAMTTDPIDQRMIYSTAASSNLHDRNPHNLLGRLRQAQRLDPITSMTEVERYNLYRRLQDSTLNTTSMLSSRSSGYPSGATGSLYPLSNSGVSLGRSTIDDLQSFNDHLYSDGMVSNDLYNQYQSTLHCNALKKIIGNRISPSIQCQDIHPPNDMNLNSISLEHAISRGNVPVSVLMNQSNQNNTMSTIAQDQAAASSFSQNIYESRPKRRLVKKSFDERYAELVEYKKIHGHCCVPSKSEGHYAALGNWCSNIRQSYKKISNGKDFRGFGLTKENMKRLDDIGFKWVVPGGRKKGCATQRQYVE